MEIDVKQMKSLALAYMGDAVYEVYIREHLLNTGRVKPNLLHQEAIKYVSGKGQATVLLNWLDRKKLSREEERVVFRARNAKSGSIPKNITVQIYRYSTGFEALLGHHYLGKNEKRLYELMEDAVKIIEKGMEPDE